MKHLVTVLAVLLTIALVAAAGVGLYFAARYVVGMVGGLGPPWSSVTAIALVTVLMAVLFVAGAVREAKKQEVMAQLAPRRAEVYGSVLAGWEADRAGQDLPPAAPDAGKQRQDAERDLLLWGGNGVIRAYRALQESDDPEDRDDEDVRDRLDRLLRAMRNDLGRNPLTLESGILAELWTGPPPS